MQAKKENPFFKHLGPLPGDPPKYIEPKDAKELAEPDPSMVSTARHQLAIREAQLRPAPPPSPLRGLEMELEDKL